MSETEEMTDQEQEARAAHMCSISAQGMEPGDLLALAVPVSLGVNVPKSNRGYRPALDRALIQDDGTYHSLARLGIAHAAKLAIEAATSINNAGGATTRPTGSKCGATWESEPYSACGAGYHWFTGPCPDCDCAVGAEGSWRSSDGPAIKARYRDVISEDKLR
jgi:hypothetical protein